MMEKVEVGMGDANYIESVLPQLEKAAGVVARKWPTVTTQEDLYSDLVIHFLERPGSLEKLALLNVTDQLGIITRVGHDKVSGQRDAFEQFSGNFHYSVGEVKALLKGGAVLENIDRFKGASFDLQEAMEELKTKNLGYWDILIRKYTKGEKFNRTSNEAKNLIPRAEESLTTLMNRSKRTEQFEWENGGRSFARPASNQVEVDQEVYEGWDDYSE